MSSALQSLMSIEGFVQMIKNEETVALIRSLRDDKPNSPSLYSELFDLVTSVFKGIGVGSLRRLKQTIGEISERFRGYQAEDAHELFLLVVNAIDTELKESLGNVCIFVYVVAGSLFLFFAHVIVIVLVVVYIFYYYLGCS